MPPKRRKEAGSVLRRQHGTRHDPTESAQPASQQADFDGVEVYQ
jgi:hypothetical protein